MVDTPMLTRRNPDEEKTFLVTISNEQLLKLGLTQAQLLRLKHNKHDRESKALAIIKQSGVPAERWPRFKDDVYYVDKDFSGELSRFIKDVWKAGTPMKGTGNYTSRNDDSTRTEYPFTVGTFLPTTNTSPIQKVIRVFTDDKGTPLITDENYDDLKDMVGYVTSSQNYRNHIFQVSSHRATNKQLATPQADTFRAYLKTFDSNLKDSQISVNYPEGDSNVLVVSLALSPSYKGEDKDAVVDYDYAQKSDNYEKFYKNTKATTVMPVSGVNIQVVFEFPSNDATRSVYLYMPDMVTVSHSVHRTKVPVTVLGDTTVTGIGLGTKMVAGSIVKVFTRRDTFHNYVKLFVDERSANMSKKRIASLTSVQNNISMNEVSDHMRDDIGPFNIHIIAMSEYDCVYQDPPKVDSILGCTIINTGKVYSVENLITEETLSFMAKTVVYDDDISAEVVETVAGESTTTGSSLLAQLRGF